MIKEGKVKLNVDISDFIYSEEGDDQSAIRMTDGSDEIDGIGNSNGSYHGILKLSFPFVMYLEGSYFGDSDVLTTGDRRYERDATAVAQSECHFFVLSRDIIQSLKRTFFNEIKEMEELAT